MNSSKGIHNGGRMFNSDKTSPIISTRNHCLLGSLCAPSIAETFHDDSIEPLKIRAIRYSSRANHGVSGKYRVGMNQGTTRPRMASTFLSRSAR